MLVGSHGVRLGRLTARWGPPRALSRTSLRQAARGESSGRCSKRDVVVRAGGRRLHGGRVHGRIADALRAAEELDGVGDDVDGLALATLLGLPLAPLEPAVDRDRPALAEIARAVLALGAPHRDVEVVG